MDQALDFDANGVEIVTVTGPEAWPAWASTESVGAFLHEKMKPYHDELEDVRRGIERALSDEDGGGGFVLVAGLKERIVGALVIVATGMGGYVPENLLLFVGVTPELRGHGLGRRLVARAQETCGGSMKLHVEPDNPAKRLYARLGFAHKYDEMRWEGP